MDTDSQPKTWRNRTTFLLTFVHFSHDMCLGILPALLPFIRDALELDYLRASGLLTALIVTAGLAQFLGGWLGDRFPRRLLVAIGVGGVGVCTLIAGLLQSYYPLIAVFLLLGLAAGPYHPSGIAMISERSRTDQRGRAMACHMVGGSAGFFVAPVLGGFIATTLGWQSTFLLLCIPALISVPLALLVLPRGAAKATTGPLPQQTGGAWVARRPVITMVVLAIVMEMVTGAGISFLALFLVDFQGFTPGAATMWIGLLRGGSVAGGLLGGYLADRWGRLQTVLLSFFTGGPALFSLLYLGGVPLLVMLFFFGLCNMMREAAVQVYLMDNTPSRFRARLIGIYFGFGLEGTSVMVPLVGFAMDNYGVASVYLWLGAGATFMSVLTPLLFSARFLRGGKSNR